MPPPEENPCLQPGRSSGGLPPASLSPRALGLVRGGGSASQFDRDARKLLFLAFPAERFLQLRDSSQDVTP